MLRRPHRSRAAIARDCAEIGCAAWQSLRNLGLRHERFNIGALKEERTVHAWETTNWLQTAGVDHALNGAGTLTQKGARLTTGQ